MRTEFKPGSLVYSVLVDMVNGPYVVEWHVKRNSGINVTLKRYIWGVAMVETYKLIDVETCFYNSKGDAIKNMHSN